MDAPLADKVALVTGASRGIGHAVAVALARAGANLMLVARNRDDLERVADECLAAGSPRVEVLDVDLADLKGLDAVVLHAVRTFEGFDILVNNAGVGQARPIAEVSDEEVQHDLDLNLRAPYLLTQAAVKVMRRRGGGQVVQVASGLAYVGRAGWSLYCAAKFGLRGFTEAVRHEVSGQGIKVALVAPGYTRTNFFDAWPAGRRPESFEHALDPTDVAHAVMAIVTQGPQSDIKEVTVRSAMAP